MAWCSIAIKTRHGILRSCLYHFYYQWMIPACFAFQQLGGSQWSKSWATGKAELIWWDKTKVTALFQVLSERNHIRKSDGKQMASNCVLLWVSECLTLSDKVTIWSEVKGSNIIETQSTNIQSVRLQSILGPFSFYNKIVSKSIVRRNWIKL